MVNKQQMANWPYKYKIESVRIPKSRIDKVYSKELYAGTSDIALIKLSRDVVFIPYKVAPVSEGNIKWQSG